MTNRSNPEHDNQRTRDGFVQLQKAINSAPIEELTAPIEAELQLGSIPDREQLRDTIDDLPTRVALAQQDAFRELTSLGNKIQSVLDGLVGPSPEPGASDSSAEASSTTRAKEADTDKSGGWLAAADCPKSSKLRTPNSPQHHPGGGPREKARTAPPTNVDQSLSP